MRRAIRITVDRKPSDPEQGVPRRSGSWPGVLFRAIGSPTRRWRDEDRRPVRGDAEDEAAKAANDDAAIADKAWAPARGVPARNEGEDRASYIKRCFDDLAQRGLSGMRVGLQSPARIACGLPGLWLA